MVDQTSQITDRDDMVKNNAGGLTFGVSAWDHLDRFLIMGTESNTYYQTSAELAKDNAKNVINLIRKAPKRVIKRVVEISEAGRAPSNDYALFVLALAASDSNELTRKLALEALPKVARTGTHLFSFVAYAEQFRGWGRAFRRAIGEWYTEKNVDALAYHAVKYQSRDGWSNRDLVRLSHPTPIDDSFDAVFRWMVSGTEGLTSGTHVRGYKPGSTVRTIRRDVSSSLPDIIQAFEEAKDAGENRIVQLIRDHNLPREAIPTHHLTSAVVWEALLQKMPFMAMVRNLATMTRVGLLTEKSEAAKIVCDRLSDQDAILRSRMHPMQILMALRTYGAGRGVRGTNTWTPVPSVVSALDGAFYKSFGNVTPTGKKTLLALDVSGSMDAHTVAGFVNLSAREAAMAMALITANVEPDHTFLAFTRGGFAADRRNTQYGSSVKEININPTDTISSAIAKVNRLPFSGTDCSLPFMWANSEKLPFENFSVYTDNETYHGTMLPSVALKKFRTDLNIPAKLAVFGLTATGFTIADPKDSGMMDFVGFDSHAPELASQFFSK